MLDFEYKLKRSGLLGGLKITIRGNDVCVTAPNFMSIAQLERYLIQKQAWIKKALEKNQVTNKNRPNEVEIFGKIYHKKIAYWPEEKLGVAVVDDELRINMINPDEKKAEAKIETYLKRMAETYIRRRTPQLAAQMGLEDRYRRVCLKKQSTRWGSCSSAGNLNFNWMLVYYSPQIIDYVLIHELSHLVEMNHSVRFWALVAKYDPEYKKHRRMLK